MQARVVACSRIEVNPAPQTSDIGHEPGRAPLPSPEGLPGAGGSINKVAARTNTVTAICEQQSQAHTKSTSGFFLIAINTREAFYYMPLANEAILRLGEYLAVCCCCYIGTKTTPPLSRVSPLPYASKKKRSLANPQRG